MVGTLRFAPYGSVSMDKDQFLAAALQNPANEIIAEELFRLALPDAWLVSGCLVQTVWNVLTSRAVDYGINDYDVFYFDPDTSWEAEDRIIRTLAERFAGRGIAVEARNQARVHLWYPEKHGLPYPELRCSTQGIDRFLTKNTQIGIRRTREGHEVYAPNGYEDVAALIVRPNPGANFSKANYAAKARRWKALWPEITVLPAE
jgi:uncharacterized protein